MINRKSVKNKGKKAFYRNWQACILVCFIFTILVGGTIISINYNKDIDPVTDIKELNINNIDGETNSDIVNEFLKEVGVNTPKDNQIVKSTKGIFGSIANNISKSGSFLFGILNAINQAVFKDRVGASIIIICGAILGFIYWAFISKVFEVGEARFFLENRKYTKTKASKIVYPYKLKFKQIMSIAKTMLVKNIYNLLWCFTLFGGLVKSYSYMLVPYILAENPNLKTKDVIKLSRDLMYGHKWEMFKLDLSFLGWNILGFLTLNVGNLVFTNPYSNATKAEAYMLIRDLGKKENVKNANLLNDSYLDGEIVFDEYPSFEYILRESKPTKKINLNYKRDYGLFDLILIAFIVAIIGWVWEVLLHLFQTGDFVNRGTLHGPWLPIYGGGALAMLVLLKKFRKKPLTYFLLSILVCGLIEYGTSLYLEVVHHMEWWNYDGYFLNINGRVCLEGLLFFGIGGFVITYFIAPLFGNILDKIKKEPKVILSVVLVTLIACDFYYSGKHPNTGTGVSNQIEDTIDTKIKDKIKY